MRSLVLITIIGWAFFCNAQSMPKWVTNKPASNNITYYYRVTIGEGINYDKAYSSAFAKAIIESSWKIGVKVKSEDDINTIENGIYENITIPENQKKLAMNKVCEYRESFNDSGKTYIRLYILWQVAATGNTTPIFDDFSDCD